MKGDHFTVYLHKPNFKKLNDYCGLHKFLCCLGNKIILLHTIIVLYKIGQAKSMSKIKAWSDAIIKYFWYCCCV